MQYAIRNSEPGSLLVEYSKLKMDSNTCFDIPGGRKDRRREAADLGPDAPMLCPMLHRRIRMRMQLLILRTHMEMTLCLRQCDRRPRRLARCHQASRRRWSRWRRSCYHCPRHHRRRYQHHHRSRPAPNCVVANLKLLSPATTVTAQICRQRPSTSAGVTARCSGGSGASCTSLPVALALPPPASPAAALIAGGGGRERWRCLPSASAGDASNADGRGNSG